MHKSVIVDSHCHLNCLADGKTPEVVSRYLQRAQDKRVGYFLCVGIDLESYPEVRDIAHAHKNVFASVGVHPNHNEGEEPSVERLVTLADDDKVVAIGETGLDYFRTSGDLTWQQKRFRVHIEASKQTKKPLIIHTREARGDTIAIMRSENARDAGGVMHCFTEDWETASAALDLGFYISLSGIVTFKSADELRDVARKVPIDRLLVETDSPYLAPVPHRGKPNEPAFVSHVVDSLAQVRGIDRDELIGRTTENFFRLFHHAHA